MIHHHHQTLSLNIWLNDLELIWKDVLLYDGSITRFMRGRLKYRWSIVSNYYLIRIPNIAQIPQDYILPWWNRYENLYFFLLFSFGVLFVNFPFYGTNWPRNIEGTAQGYFPSYVFTWNGGVATVAGNSEQFIFSTLAPDQYRIRISALRNFGNPQNSNDIERFVTPKFRLVYWWIEHIYNFCPWQKQFIKAHSFLYYLISLTHRRTVNERVSNILNIFS